MVWLAVGAGFLLLGLALLRAFAFAPVAAVRQVGLGILAGLGLLVAAVLLLTGRAGQVFWLLALLGPFGWRAWRRWFDARRFRQPADADRESAVRTATLAMTLDHESGQMGGTVLSGAFEGRALASLSPEELTNLLAACRANDPESVPLLEVWLDRERPDWREPSSAAPPRAGPMTREEALGVLGLAPGADAAAIRAAHRRLMQAAHPDRGGSDWLAARVNEARDVLLP